MKKEITELKNIHKDMDIYVIASGASMDYVEPSFFDGKIVIGVNNVYKKYRCSYLVRKEMLGLKCLYETGITLIVSKYDCGNRPRENKVKGQRDYYYFEHEENEHKNVNLSVIGTDKIVVSYSTTTSAMHLAAYLGAKNIILCGHDCGKFDGKLHYEGYYPSGYGCSKWYQEWINEIQPQSIAVRDKLVEVYGCNIYSLSPFINLGMEDHVIGG